MGRRYESWSKPSMVIVTHHVIINVMSTAGTSRSFELKETWYYSC